MGLMLLYLGLSPISLPTIRHGIHVFKQTYKLFLRYISNTSSSFWWPRFFTDHIFALWRPQLQFKLWTWKLGILLGGMVKFSLSNYCRLHIKIRVQFLLLSCFRKKIKTHEKEWSLCWGRKRHKVHVFLWEIASKLRTGSSIFYMQTPPGRIHNNI